LQHRRRHWHYLRCTTWRLPSRIYTSLCACVRARARACVPASGKIGGFFWKNKIELHLGLRIKCSKCPPLFRKPNRSLLSKFFNTYLGISGVSPSQTLFYSCLIRWSVHSRKQYFSNNPKRKNPASLNLVSLEATGLVLLDLSNNGL